ncbi:MAG: M81 family metallopeptidase, partial [Planctomycetes bacterium]|nr:M81 family metallopeptidase [Planctomycetota bacterium]
KHIIQSLQSHGTVAGVLESLIVLGHVWNDMRWMGVSTLVVTDGGIDSGKKLSEGVAQDLWDHRKEFRFEMECLSISDGIKEASRAGSAHPIFLTDNGDNVTGGGTGDLTIVLQEMIRGGVTDAVVAGIVSPSIVRKCFKEGVGKHVRIRLGCDHSLLKDRTMDVTSTVVAIGDSLVQAPFFYGRMGPWVKVRIGGILATFHERRVGIVTRQHLAELGIDPLKHRVYVVKQGYLFPDLQEIAGRYILLLSPGSMEFDMSRNPYKNIQRPIWPIDPEMSWDAAGKAVLVD